MSQATYTNILAVEIGGPIPNALANLLAEGWVDAGVNMPAAFQLSFSDPGRAIMDSYGGLLRIGAEVKLFPITDGVQGQPLITGEITALEADADGSDKLLVVRGYDPGHRLLRNRRVVGYPNMTATDIVRKVAGMCGVELGKVDSTTTTYELATQPNISDWDFLSRLARENGVHLYVNELGLLQFTDLVSAAGAPPDTMTARQSPYVLEFETNAMRSRVVVTSADQVDTVEVRGWNVQAKTPLTELTPALSSEDIEIGVTPAEVSSMFGAARLTAADVPYDTQAEVLKASKALADDITSSFAELEITVTGNPALHPGLPVALKGGGFPFEGRYTVTGTRHVFTGADQYQTWVSVTGRQMRSLYGLASGGADTAPKMPGVVSALVTNTQDPLRQGRVKLTFPWLSADYESDWCRVAQFGGVHGGGLFLPDVHDEVLVAFDRGALDHPYVIAGLYNGVDQPTPDPDAHPQYDPTNGAINWRSLASRNGHMVELLEVREPPSSGIRLSTGEKKLLVHLDETDPASATITISATREGPGATITISNTGAITIDGGTSVSVKAGADLNLEATGAVSIKGATVSVSSLGALNLAAAGIVDIDAGADVTIDAVADVSIDAIGLANLTATTELTLAAVDVTMVGVVTANGIPVA
ncbi:VgrG-related protein [Streptacidiphilus sp. PB12-B1b]|uniref:VgrG-related protein n=1 Tax=Streptacidiphilus sp. PB12-B1b TaxID=2705012 RepID=UPI0015F836D3|nr:VgrG-related protein [Streptacidiphilus sp. PB12-B1b]QMU77669.1 VgrG-related protein [Streptacidiphilus sp. PB12-B1b]